MPIIRHYPMQNQAIPEGVRSLNQHRINLLMHGRPSERVLAQDEPGAATWGEAWKSQLGVSLWQSTFDTVARGVATEDEPDPDFNPYKHIQDTPDLRDDPRIRMLVERGQFDDSENWQQFQFDLETGLRYLDDVDTLQRTSWPQYLGTLATSMVIDPANVIPGGVAFKGARAAGKLSTLARVGAGAAEAGALTFAAEKLQNTLQPASNEPGISNELMATAFGASLGAGLGLLASPAADIGGRVNRMVSSAKLTRLNQRIEQVMNQPRFRPATLQRGDDTTVANSQFAMGARGIDDNLPPEQRLNLKSLEESWREGQELLKGESQREPVDNTVVSVLRREGDENDALLQQVRKQYKDAGKTLHVVDHPDQWYFDLTAEHQQIMSEPTFNVEATSDDLNHSFVNKAVGSVMRRYANAQAHVTPGGRLAQANLGRIQDVYRTLSGSAQTVTQGSARDPFNFQPGAPAESIQQLYEASKDMAQLNLRHTWNKHRKKQGETVTYNGQALGRFRDFNAAVVDLMRRRHARHQGYEAAIPEDASPAVLAGEKTARQYLLHMRDQMEIAGALSVGPRRLKTERQNLQGLQQRLFEAQRKLETAEQRAAQQRDLFEERGGFTIGDINARLASYTDELPSALDEAETIIQNIRNDPDAPENLPDGFAVRPDDIEHLTPDQKARFHQRAIVSDDASEVADVIGQNLYEQAINELAGGKRARAQGLIDELLNEPDGFDPEVTLDAQLQRLWQGMDQAERRIERLAVDPAKIPEGESVRVFGADWTVRMDGDEKVLEGPDLIFGADELRQLPLDADDVQRLGLEGEPTSRRQIGRGTRARRRVERLQKHVQRQKDTLKQVEQAVDDQQFYLPRVFDTASIMANEADFKQRLVRSFRKSDETADGVRVDEDQRPLLAEVANKIDQRQLAAAKARKLAGGDELTDELRQQADDMPVDQLIDDMTEADLRAVDDRLMEAYRAELDTYYDRNAQAVFEKLTQPEERHGVADGMAQDHLKQRAMGIDESDLGPYMVDNLEEVLERYHRVVSGRTATRRAIQLNSDVWENVRLRDGSPIETGQDLIKYLNETLDVLERHAAFADKQAGKEGARFGRSVPAVQKLRQRVNRDIKLPMDLMEGRQPLGHGSQALEFFSSMGRSALRLSYLNKLGSVFWAQLNDLAPLSLYMLQQPGSTRRIGQAIGHLKSLPKRDLEVMGTMFDNMTRQRSIADVDYANTGIGFGTGVTREMSARAEEGLRWLGDQQSRVGLMNWITNTNKQVSGAMMLDRVGDQSRRLLRAQRLIDAGTDQGKALRDVGLSNFDAARLNKIGLNVKRAKRYHALVYRHGLDKSDNPIRDRFTFDQYLKSKEMFKPNFADWPTKSRAVKDLMDTVTANLNGEVNRTLVVTPGVFDRPLINHTVIGRMFNQFQGFLMAFVNQRLKVMAQMPASGQAWYMMAYLGLGAFSDAVANAASGRRSFEETARLWEDEPLAMTYTAFERSGMAGWLGRPLHIADSLGVPMSPGNLLTQNEGTTAASHVRPGEFLTYLGPAADDLDRSLRIAHDMASLDVDKWTGYNAWKLMPFQNLLWLRMGQQGLNQADVDVPIVPSKLLEEEFGERPPEP